MSGFGNSVNISVHALEAFNGHLYAGATNYDQEGATVWRTTKGITWTVSSSPGFSNTYTNTNPVIYDFIEFNGDFYAGTGNWSNDGVGARFGVQTTEQVGHQ